MSNPSRVSPGVPTGGQFATTQRDESDVDLGEGAPSGKPSYAPGFKPDATRDSNIGGAEANLELGLADTSWVIVGHEDSFNSVREMYHLESGDTGLYVYLDYSDGSVAIYKHDEEYTQTDEMHRGTFDAATSNGTNEIAAAVRDLGEPDPDSDDDMPYVQPSKVINGELTFDASDNYPYAPLAARLVMPGDSYGATGSLTHDSDDPLVEFYDARYPHTPYGQFVSRYYLSTLADRKNDPRSQNAGLDLDGGIGDWTATATTTNNATEWAQQETIRRRSIVDVREAAEARRAAILAKAAADKAEAENTSNTTDEG